MARMSNDAIMQTPLWERITDIVTGMCAGNDTEIYLRDITPDATLMEDLDMDEDEIQELGCVLHSRIMMFSDLQKRDIEKWQTLRDVFEMIWRREGCGKQLSNMDCEQATTFIRDWFAEHGDKCPHCGHELHGITQLNPRSGSYDVRICCPNMICSYMAMHLSGSDQSSEMCIDENGNESFRVNGQIVNRAEFDKWYKRSIGEIYQGNNNNKTCGEIVQQLITEGLPEWFPSALEIHDKIVLCPF